MTERADKCSSILLSSCGINALDKASAFSKVLRLLKGEIGKHDKKPVELYKTVIARVDLLIELNEPTNDLNEIEVATYKLCIAYLRMLIKRLESGDKRTINYIYATMAQFERLEKRAQLLADSLMDYQTANFKFLKEIMEG